MVLFYRIWSYIYSFTHMSIYLTNHGAFLHISLIIHISHEYQALWEGTWTTMTMYGVFSRNMIGYVPSHTYNGFTCTNHAFPHTSLIIHISHEYQALWEGTWTTMTIYGVFSRNMIGYVLSHIYNGSHTPIMGCFHSSHVSHFLLWWHSQC